MTLMVIVRKVYKLTDYITDNHMDAIARILILYRSSWERLISLKSLPHGIPVMNLRCTHSSGTGYSGSISVQFWGMVICNALIPQLFWFKKLRRNWVSLLLISLAINVGMWLERFNIVITSLTKDFLPSNWTSYTPTVIDIGVFAGTVGLFGVGVLLFMRYIPLMAVSELKGVANIGSKIED